MLGIKTLKGQIISQFVVVIAPITLLLVVQSFLEIQRSHVLNQSSLAYDRAVESRLDYQVFVNGVTDAVDTGKLGQTSVESLNKVKIDLEKLGAIYPSRDMTVIVREVDPMLKKITADPSIASLIPFRDVIRGVDKAITGEAEWHRKSHAGIHQEIIQAADKKNVIVLVAALVTLLIAAYFIHRMIVSLTRPLSLAISVANKIAQGDLNNQIDVRGGNEIGQLLESLKVMNENLLNIVGGVKAASDTLTTSSSKLFGETDDVMNRANMQSERVVQVSAAMEEMSASSKEIAISSTGTAEAAAKAQSIVHISTASMAKNMEITGRIVETVKSSSKSVSELSREIQKIGEITTVIKEIADQTSLLALNAAIEAARAGEQGRGFAVVADEVKKLAGRTSSSTVDITNMVSAIEQKTQAVVESMNRVMYDVGEGARDSRSTSETLQQIVVAANEVTDLATHIAGAVKEQSAASGETAKNMEKFLALTEENTASIHAVRDASKKLTSMSVELQRMVGQFKLRT